MTDNIVSVHPAGGALSAEHYQTFEMAKENDGILGGSDIAEIRSYAAFARAQAQAVRKSIAAMSELNDVTATKAEMTETAQTFAKVGIYADQRIGEILRELPTRQGRRTDLTSVDTPTKVETEKSAGISHAVSIDLQAMAANPEIVQAVLDKAEAEGRIPSRKQVLDAKAVMNRVNEVLKIDFEGGRVADDSIITDQLYRGGFISRLYTDAKNHSKMGESYTETLKVDFGEVMDYIGAWEPEVDGGTDGYKHYLDIRREERSKRNES